MDLYCCASAGSAGAVTVSEVRTPILSWPSIRHTYELSGNVVQLFQSQEGALDTAEHFSSPICVEPLDNLPILGTKIDDDPAADFVEL